MQADPSLALPQLKLAAHQAGELLRYPRFERRVEPVTSEIDALPRYLDTRRGPTKSLGTFQQNDVGAALNRFVCSGGTGGAGPEYEKLEPH